MNERIKQLAEQATVDIKDEFGFWIGSEIDKEKFAELIVLECTDKMYKVMQGTEPADLAYNAMLTAIIADIHQSFDLKDKQFTRSMENAFKHGIDLSGQETP